MKHYFGFVFVVLLSATFFSTTLFAQPEGISIVKTNNGYKVNFSLMPFEYNQVFGNGKEFLDIKISGYGVTPDVGLPALPLISFNLFIGDDEKSPSVRILSQDIKTITLDKQIYPKQMPWEKNKSLDDRPFTINQSYYNSRGIERQLVSLSEPFNIGGVSGIMITIYPFNYNPKDNELAITSSGTFEIILNDPVETEARKSDSFNDFLKGIFVNYQPQQSIKSMRMLIITAPTFESGLSSFVTHKGSQGFTIDLFNTTATGTTTTAIKTFIQNRYDDPATRPEFVILIGDVQHIPSWIGSGTGSPNTDLNYVQLSGGDKFADAFIGRFSVTTLQELQNALNKSIYMETYISTLPKKNIWMASTDNYQYSEGTHNYCINTHFQPNNWVNLKLYTVTYNATTQQLINALNDNQRFAVYSGHGAETYWADGPQLTQSQVRALTNTGMYPFVYSFSCVTGSYQISESFGETWIRATNGGSGFYGSSVNSYWDEDDILERRLFDAMFIDDITRITPMFDQAKIYLANYYGGVTGMVLRYLEMYNLMGDPSLPVVRQIPPDTTPPDQITDLSVGDATSNSLSLNWTAPYDSTFNGVTSYDLRFSTNPITNDDDFNNAEQRILTGVSDTAGTPRSFVIDGLNFNTTYYFAAKAMDMWNNKSIMSNVPTGVTLYTPLASVSADSIHCTAIPNTTFTEYLVLSNASSQNSTLDYLIELKNNTFPDNVIVTLTGVNDRFENQIKSIKDFPNDLPGLSFEGFGGPDAFGYKWIDSNEPNGPQYVWDDIVSTGTLVTNWTATSTFNPKDEGYAGPFPLGFNFKFYGNIKTQIYVSSNGVILFSPITSNIYTNATIPSTAVPNEFIAPFWDDLDGVSSGTVHYKQDGNRFIVQFTGWHRYSNQGSLTFQVVLYSSGKIMVYYNNMSGTLNSATIGIENAAGTDGLMVAYNANYVANNLALQFSAEPEWLVLNNYSGTIYAGNSVNIGLMINTEDLELGEYSMDIEISTNDPANQIIVVPVSMTVQNEVPVELLSFIAEIKDENVLFNWSTATETNNSGFEIQKIKPEDRSKNFDWLKVGFVEGKGTSTEKTVYSFKENNVTPGLYAYRLKQIDFDGSFKYSNEIEVEVSTPKEFVLYQNFPNPFNPSTTIKFALPVKTNLSLSVYNTLGEKVAEIFNGELEEGYHEMMFNASGLSSGIYFYKIESENYSATKKLILLK